MHRMVKTDRSAISVYNTSLWYIMKIYSSIVSSILYLKMRNAPTSQKKINNADDALAQYKSRG